MTLALPQRHGSGAAIGHLSGREKAAVIVRLLLSEGAEPPLKALPERLQTALTEQMGRMRAVDRDTLRAVAEDFCQRIDAFGLAFPGGIADALALLEGHISSAAAQPLKKLTGAAPADDPWPAIAALPIERLAPLLSRESPEVGAIILSKLPAARAAELLASLPGDRARRLAYGVAQTGKVAPATVHKIGATLAQEFASVPPRAFDMGPGERVGAILNLSPAATRDEVLAGLADEDAEFADAVRKSIFTFAHIPARLDPRDVPKAVRGVDQAVLVRALAGAGGPLQDVAEFILAAMSQRLAATLREEMAEIGKVKERDAEQAQTAIVGAIRDLVDAGEIKLRSEEE